MIDLASVLTASLFIRLAQVKSHVYLQTYLDCSATTASARRLMATNKTKANGLVAVLLTDS